MLEVEWSETARADLVAIVEYISDRDIGAAEHLRDDIEAKAATLSKRPKLYRPGRIAGTREMLVRRRYLVIYSERPDAVVVLRVLHTAQRWPVRLGS